MIVKDLVETEFAIIGAGIMGLSTGLNLARAGKEVVILDRCEPWSEASGVNAGSLAVQNKRLPLIPFALEASRIWMNFHKELGKDVGYVQSGGLRVATTSEEVDRLRDSAAKMSNAGIELEWLERSALEKKVPWLGDRVRAATFCPVDGFGDPLTAGKALIDAVSEAGCMIIPRAKVYDIKERPKDFHLDTLAGSLLCKTLIIAAGAWSGQITRLLGVELPIHLEVDMLTVTEPAPKLMDLIVTHIRGILTLKQFPNGTCIIGGGWEGRGDLDSGRKDLDYESLLHNIRLAASIVPSLSNVQIVRSWAGFEGATPDFLPFFGRLPGYSGVFITACARAGWTLGPLFGRLMTELVLTNKTSLPITEFDPGRFLK